MATKTLKIRYSREGQAEEVRRLGVPVDIPLDSLRQLVAPLFRLPQDASWHFKWTDEEKDTITLSEEHELRDLFRVKSNDAVIQLTVHVVGTARPRKIVRYNARCDATNAKLQPGTGEWYHRPGTSNDLCKAVYDRLDSEAKKAYVLVRDADDLGTDKGRYETPRGCRGVPPHCRRGQMHTPLPSPHGFCDVTGRPLVVGEGWYHKIGTTYDLCSDSYAQLSEADKGAFVAVMSSDDLGEEGRSYGVASRCHISPRMMPLPQMIDALADLAADFIDIHVSDASPSPPPPAPTAPPRAPTPPPVVSAMELVSGPSIAAGSSVKGGTRLLPVWEVRNSAPRGLWTEVRIKPLAPNLFCMGENGVEVPMLEAGATGLITLDLCVPADAPAGQLTAAFTLVDADGNAFGSPLVVDVVVIVEDSKSAKEAEAVQLLLDMALGDALTCLKTLRECRGDVNAAAVALLRANRK